MIVLDGSSGEGGGQMVRTALAMSTLTGKPFRIENIRAGRTKPGLKAQHLKCIEALVEWTGAHAEGNKLGSPELTFIPGKLKGKTVPIDIGTAGSITLLMQALLLPALFAPGPVRFSIRGGTDVQWAPSWDYFANVILPHYRCLGRIEANVIKRGYYPRGGGQVSIRVTPIHQMNSHEEFPHIISELSGKPINLTDQGILHAVRGVSHASEQLAEREVAERQARACHHTLIKLGMPVNISSSYQNTDSVGSGISVWALFSHIPNEIIHEKPLVLGADSLGKQSFSSESVGESAGKALVLAIKSGACADVHLADNLIPLLAIMGGSFIAESISNHTLTNISVVKSFLDVDIKTDGNKVFRK